MKCCNSISRDWLWRLGIDCPTDLLQFYKFQQTWLKIKKKSSFKIVVKTVKIPISF